MQDPGCYYSAYQERQRMKIRFGLQLDGLPGCHASNTHDEITLGTNGLLNILESRMGILAAPYQLRIVQYLDCLKRCDDVTRFYHKSLEADEFGTAATLLWWRDQWHLHGWSGEFELASTPRLIDMQAVERAAHGKLSASEGERLAALMQLMEVCTPAVAKVTLLTPLAVIPKRWQQLLSRLPTTFTPIIIQQNNTFLNELQYRLCQVQAGEVFSDAQKLTFKADGSVVIVRAETRILASYWLAAQLKQGITDGLLVASDSAALLNDIVVSAEQHGMIASWTSRPALQLLPMAMALLWKPLDFNVLMAFLNHPISPIDNYARHQLAAKLAEKPGIVGAEWDQLLEELAMHYVDQTVIEQIHAWIDHPRYEQKSAAPVAEVMFRAQMLASYFTGLLTDSDETSLASCQAGLAQVADFICALQQLAADGKSFISQRQLQKLLTRFEKYAIPEWVAGTGALAVVDNPAAVIENFDQVIWWQPVMPLMPKAYPWSIKECRELAASGVALPTISDILEYQAADWLKPILAARNRLILVLPPLATEVHPVWQMIKASVRDIAEQSLERILNGAADSVADSEPLLHTPLPDARRWWQLPAHTPVPKQDYVSFSSMESFLFNPFQWLLRYPAGLKPSSLLSVSDGFKLDGLLAHRLIEEFFSLRNALTMSEVAIQEWFVAAFPALVETEGAVLLMHGRRSDYEGLRYRLQRTLNCLLAHIKATDTQKVQSELKLKGHYAGETILGYADLVLNNHLGLQAVIDMKWRGGKKYALKLAENTHLQLAIYAELIHQQTGDWPEVAYYILSDSSLLTQHPNYFPDGNVVLRKSGEATSNLWERFKISHAWRSGLLQQGKIEVVLDGLMESEDSMPPEDGLKPEILNSNYNDYLVLAGRRQA